MDDVELNEFKESGKYAEQFLRDILSFPGDLNNSFLDSVLRGLLFKVSENNKMVSSNDVEKVLGVKFYEELNECRERLQLDDSLDVFFKKCALVNEFLITKSTKER